MHFRRLLPARPVAALTGLTFFSALGFAQPVTLKLNVKPGASFTAVYSNKMTMEGGGPFAAMGNVSQTMNSTLKVGSTGPKGTLFVMKVTDVKVTVPKDSPAAGMMKNSADQIKGSTFEMLVSAQCKVLSTKPIGSANANEASVARLGAQSMGPFGVEYPTRPIAPGATWSTTMDLSKLLGNAAPGIVRAGQNAKIPVKYTLIGVSTQGSRRVAKIGVAMAGSMEFSIGGAPPPNGPTGRSQMPPMKIKMTLQSKGTVEVDLATGMALRGSSAGTTSSSVAGMNMVQKMSTSFTVR